MAAILVFVLYHFGLASEVSLVPKIVDSKLYLHYKAPVTLLIPPSLVKLRMFYHQRSDRGCKVRKNRVPYKLIRASGSQLLLNRQ